MGLCQITINYLMWVFPGSWPAFLPSTLTQATRPQGLTGLLVCVRSPWPPRVALPARWAYCQADIKTKGWGYGGDYPMCVTL